MVFSEIVDGRRHRTLGSLYHHINRIKMSSGQNGSHAYTICRVNCLKTIKRSNSFDVKGVKTIYLDLKEYLFSKLWFQEVLTERNFVNK